MKKFLTYGELVAHCFMSNGKPVYDNYQKYYGKPHKKTKKSLWKDLDDNKFNI